MDWQPVAPEGYNDTNRALLQALMSRGTLTFDEGKPILAAILAASRGDDEAEIEPEAITEELFEEHIAMIREAVSPLDLDIRGIPHQLTRERVWALTNMHSDPSTQLATVHSAEEIAFVKRVLDAMFETFNTPRMEVMALTEAQALKLAKPARNRASIANGGDGGAQSSDKGLKHSEVLALLPTLLEEGWMEKSRTGFYSLSPRSLMELWGWLNETYNDPDAEGTEWQRIKFCEACKEIVTVGQRCAERDCNVRLHEICQEAFWRSRRDKKCPKCETPWDGKHFVGERAVTETEAYKKSKQRKGAGRRSDIVEDLMAQNAEEEADEDESAMVEG